MRATPRAPREAVRPVVVVSQCLGFEAVRYNAQVLRAAFVQALEEHVDFIQVCPEVGIGLGVPRDPIRIVQIGGENRLVQPATGADVTERMRAFSAEFLAALPPVDGFILKSRSPAFYPPASGPSSTPCSTPSATCPTGCARKKSATSTSCWKSCARRASR